MPWLFLKQSRTGPDAKLCGFFALYHFKNGNVTRDQYLEKAAITYTKLGISLADAKMMAADGNDPGTYKLFGLHQGTKDAVDKFTVLIVCDVNRGHFYTIRKEDQEWYNYDSYNYNNSTLIGDNNAAKNLIGDKMVFYS